MVRLLLMGVAGVLASAISAGAQIAAPMLGGSTPSVTLKTDVTGLSNGFPVRGNIASGENLRFVRFGATVSQSATKYKALTFGNKVIAMTIDDDWCPTRPHINPEPKEWNPWDDPYWNPCGTPPCFPFDFVTPATVKQESSGSAGLFTPEGLIQFRRRHPKSPILPYANGIFENSGDTTQFSGSGKMQMNSNPYTVTAINGEAIQFRPATEILNNLPGKVGLTQMFTGH